MKTITSVTLKTFFLFSFFFSLFSASAQAPQKMSYQAVIRNASNVLIANTNIRMRISVLQGTATGTAVYTETQTATSNSNGLVTIEIGAGTVVSGTFASIAWGTNAYFIKTETDPTGGTNYTITGTTQFVSVPYALFAASGNSGPAGPAGPQGPQGISGSSVWTATGVNIANNNAGNVGIGTGATIPYSPLTVKANNIGFTQEDASGASRVGFYTSATSAWLQTHSNTNLSFATNNNATSQMTLQTGTGNFGIGTTTPTEKLEVAGKTKTTNLQVTTGAGAGKVLTSDATGNATWETPATQVVNQEIETTVAALSTTIQGAEVDFPTTNITIPAAGTYLITYFVQARNLFTLYCANSCSNPKVYNTRVYITNKTSSVNYQGMDIDFLNSDSQDVEGTSTLTIFSLPSHQVSGSIVKTLPAGTQIGVKVRSFSEAGATGNILVDVSTVTAVRLR